MLAPAPAVVGVGVNGKKSLQKGHDLAFTKNVEIIKERTLDMLIQDNLTGYLHEVPDYQLVGDGYAEALEPQLGFVASFISNVLSWAPYQDRPWLRPPYLSEYWRNRHFNEVPYWVKRNAYFRWQQDQGVAPVMPGVAPPGMYPPYGMPGMPMPGMPIPSIPGLAPGLPMPGVPILAPPGMPGLPGMLPGALAPASSPRRRRRRRR